MKLHQYNCASRMATLETTVIIVGGGPGGLALAQGLRKRGIPFHVLERGMRDRHQGYRFRLMDYAVDTLPSLLPTDLWELLESSRPASMAGRDVFIDALSGQFTRREESRFDHIYSMDRTWLHELLLTGIEEDISFEKSFASYSLDDNGVTVTCSDGTTIKGKMVVGADGNFSAVRRQFLPVYPLLDIGRTLLWGKTYLTEDFLRKFGSTGRGKELLEENVVIALDKGGSATSCLFAPMRWPKNGKLSEVSPSLSDQRDYMFSVLGLSPPEDPTRLSTHTGRVEYAKEVTKEWIPELRTIFEMQDDSLTVSVVSGIARGISWETDRRVTFVGDAGHPSNGGRGGTMAFVDAFELSETLGQAWNGQSFDSAKSDNLERYEVGMRERGEEAMSASMILAKTLFGGSDNPDDYTEWKFTGSRAR